MQITVWNDYICPWAYLGRQRTRVLVALGHDVTVMPYELHPEITTPREVRVGGRLHTVFAHIADECRSANVDFNPPPLVVNSRRALEVAEIVRKHHPEAFGTFDDAVARAYFVDGLDISSLEVMSTTLDECGLDSANLLESLDEGDGVLAVVVSMERARDSGITATPAWLLPNGFVIPGVQPVAQMTRWVSKIASRQDSAPPSVD